MNDISGHITGLGGIFIKSKDKKGLSDWYCQNLGFPFDGYGSSFLFRDYNDPDNVGYSVWGPFSEQTDYFKPSEKDFMINLRVRDLPGFLEKIKALGVTVVGEMEEHDEGRFAWVLDPEGTKIELWEQLGDAPEAKDP